MITIEEQSGRLYTCKGCGRKIRYHLEDVQERELSEHVREDEHDLSYADVYTECSITCPACGHKNKWIAKTLRY